LGEFEFYNYFFISTSNSNDDWIIDSGATNHLTFQKHLLVNFDEKFSDFIEIADGSKVKCSGRGDIEIMLKGNDRDIQWSLRNVLYVPQINANLISVNKLTRGGL
jgi:hypothetical protein